MTLPDSPQALRALPAAALPEVCAGLREEIIAVCGKVGGHLGASLGAVELTVALHRVFHSPTDALVFDVGHQAYAHKLLTGRREALASLRQEGGLAPFLDPTESPHDAFGAGHACTAISVGLGLLEGRRLRGAPGRVVAVVGDGALTGGLSFEGLNNVGTAPLTVVLNDNGMSISANVGAVSRLLINNPRGFFEGLGLSYLGPIDGHDLVALEAALREAKAARLPTVVHVLTQKGKGFDAAEADGRTRGHAMGPFELRAGKLVRSRGGARTYSDGFAQALEALMAADPRVVAVTPAMLEGSSLVGLQERFPSRVHDVGIAEQHAVAYSAGLAAAGARPVCVIYSTFLQRAYDQLVHDVALPGLDVIFAVDRAGLVGADGATHQGAFDIGFLRALPGVTVAAAVTLEDLQALLGQAVARGGPWAIRFPRGTLPEVTLPAVGARGEARWLKRAQVPTLTFATFGPSALAALEAAADEPGFQVVDLTWASPLDRGALREAASSSAVVIVEEGAPKGGVGGAALEVLAELGLSPRVQVVALPDQFVRHGEARAQRKALGLDAAGLLRTARALLARAAPASSGGRG